MDDAYEDYNDWWNDLTIEQRRAAYFAWLKTDMKTVYYEDIAPKTDNTTHSNIVPPAHLFEINNKRKE